jgi:hypothetical protein
MAGQDICTSGELKCKKKQSQKKPIIAKFAKAKHNHEPRRKIPQQPFSRSIPQKKLPNTAVSRVLLSMRMHAKYVFCHLMLFSGLENQCLKSIS